LRGEENVAERRCGCGSTTKEREKISLSTGEGFCDADEDSFPIVPHPRVAFVALMIAKSPPEMLRTTVFLAVAAIGLIACADDGFAVRRAAEFPRGGTTNMSVLGIFKDGRMNAESWDELGAGLSAPFSERRCEVAYSNKLVTTLPALSTAVDDYARANGVTDDLLDQLAPMAKGDTILFITIAGHPPQAVDNAGVRPSSSPTPMRGGSRRRGGGLPSPSDRSARSSTDRSVFEVSATLFSRQLHHSVAIIDMTYSGSSVEDALRKFAVKLGSEMPRSTCTGWDWDTPVDASQIRKLSEE
jgi:hypothetical protein